MFHGLIDLAEGWSTAAEQALSLRLENVAIRRRLRERTAEVSVVDIRAAERRINENNDLIAQLDAVR